jgi:predicted S18 family serine protease
VTLTKVQEKLQKNTKLAEKLESRLPKGTDLMEAADGFRNLGQFVAAVNVSNNLGLDFEKLKTAMIDDGKSLGQAIQTVKKDVDSPTLVAQRAETDAQTLIQQTEKQPTTTTTTTTSTTTTKTKSKDKPKRTLRTQSGS